MSVVYVCDYCGKQIPTGKKNVIQAVGVGSETKLLFHACTDCYNKVILPVLNGKCSKEQSNDGDIITPSKTEQDVASHTAEVKQDEEENKIDDGTFNHPVLSRKSKYFSDELCYDFHRYVLLGAKAKVLSEFFAIPYVNVTQYLQQFKDKDFTYEPETSIKTLEKIKSKYASKLDEVDGLLVSCRFSLKDVSEETGVDMAVLKTYWYNLPWFKGIKGVKEN